jgi:hypothetical protein
MPQYHQEGTRLKSVTFVALSPVCVSPCKMLRALVLDSLFLWELPSACTLPKRSKRQESTCLLRHPLRLNYKKIWTN